MNWLWVSMAFSLLVGTGCGGLSRIAPPDWEPDEMADSAITLNDTDGNGELGEKELETAGGLRAAVEREGQNSADKNGDGKLSRDEIRERIQLFEDSQTGIEMFAITVFLGKKPLGGAQVVLEPEPFLAGVLSTPQCETRSDGVGRPETAIGDLMGVQPGMYRVVITHPDVEIPARYNQETTLGVDLSPDTSGYSSNDRFTFKLKKK